MHGVVVKVVDADGRECAETYVEGDGADGGAGIGDALEKIVGEVETCGGGGNGSGGVGVDGLVALAVEIIKIGVV